MMKLKVFIVKALEVFCEKTHWLTWHAPVRWIIPLEYLSSLSFRLDEKWKTGVWPDGGFYIWIDKNI